MSEGASALRVEGADFVYSFSAGSVNHEAATCKPCLFLRTSVGCSKGAECEFCHLHHACRPRAGPNRPGKGKRDRYKKMVARMEEEMKEKGVSTVEELQALKDNGGPQPAEVSEGDSSNKTNLNKVQRKRKACQEAIDP